AELRQEGQRRPLGQPVDQPVHKRLAEEREQDDEEHPQHEVERPGEVLVRQRGCPAVVRQVPDQPARHSRPWSAAPEQRGWLVVCTEHRQLHKPSQAAPPSTIPAFRPLVRLPKLGPRRSADDREAPRRFGGLLTGYGEKFYRYLASLLEDVELLSRPKQ